MTYNPEADAIIAELDACKTRREVDDVARKHGRAVHLMGQHPKSKPHMFRVQNMARYQRLILAFPLR